MKQAAEMKLNNITTLMILSGMVRGRMSVNCDRGGPWFCKQVPQPTQDDIEHYFRYGVFLSPLINAGVELLRWLRGAVANSCMVKT